MPDRDIPALIGRFPYWHYRFDLNGHLTPVSEPIANRHAQRKAYFFDPLVRLFGGTLAGKRVLDLGCNAGFWSLCALEAGCEYVVGIDAHPVNLAQAQFVFDVKGISRQRYQFKRAVVGEASLGQSGEFDIVLCLGLLYHLHQPVTLLEQIARANQDVLVIDTRLSTCPGRVLELSHESRALPDTLVSATGHLVTLPTRQAILEIATHLGYRLVVLQPRFTKYLGAEEYQTGRRRAMVCAKQTDLANLPAEIEASPPIWRRLVDLARWHRTQIRCGRGQRTPGSHSR